MINSLNSAIDSDKLDLMMEELENREEMLCVGNGCVGAVNPCVGQACAAGCIGITVCALGAHVG